jgi:hypothetical protein
MRSWWRSCAPRPGPTRRRDHAPHGRRVGATHHVWGETPRAPRHAVGWAICPPW